MALRVRCGTGTLRGFAPFAPARTLRSTCCRSRSTPATLRPMSSLTRSPQCASVSTMATSGDGHAERTLSGGGVAAAVRSRSTSSDRNDSTSPDEVRKHRGGVGAQVSSASDANSPARLPRPTTPGLPPRRPPRHQPASTADHVPTADGTHPDPLRQPTTGFLGVRGVVALVCLSDDGVSILRWRCGSDRGPMTCLEWLRTVDPWKPRATPP